jgi:hypothetical protein
LLSCFKLSETHNHGLFNAINHGSHHLPIIDLPCGDNTSIIAIRLRWIISEVGVKTMTSQSSFNTKGLLRIIGTIKSDINNNGTDLSHGEESRAVAHSQNRAEPRVDGLDPAADGKQMM